MPWTTGFNYCEPVTKSGRRLLLQIRREAEDEGATWSEADEDHFGEAIRDIEIEAEERGREEERLIAAIFGPSRPPSHAARSRAG